MLQFLRLAGVVVIALAAFSSCEKAPEPAYQTEQHPKIMLDVSYGNDPKQKMDVYLPSNRSTNTSIVIFVHGGSFIYGDKNDFSSFSRYLAASGYAVANINYRLVDATGLYNDPTLHKESSVKVEDQVDDVSAAVDFVIKNAKSWVASNRRIAIAGHSAGGTLALLYGYDARNMHKVQAISNIAGALDLVYTNYPSWQTLPPYVLESGFRFTGAKVEEGTEQHYKNISPMYAANKNQQIPTLNIFPEYNYVDGLPRQDVYTYYDFNATLGQLGVPNEFLFLNGADHNLSKEAHQLTALQATIAYFNKNIK